MDWSIEQLQILDQASRNAAPAYLRVRCLAIWQIAQGKTRQEAALFLRTTRQSVGKWVRDFRQQGLDGLRIHKGRGRKASDHRDVEDYLYSSPRDKGLNRTRWTLDLLAQQVPSLKGFSRAGVRKVLPQLGLGYKRGQPHLHSPDPQYLGKKRGSKK